MDIAEMDFEEIAKTVLSSMQIGRELMLWDDWWVNIVGQSVPRERTVAYEQYKKDRLAVKNRVNDKFTQRQTSHALFCQYATGVYLLNGREANDQRSCDRYRKAANALLAGMEQLKAASVCAQLEGDQDDANYLRHQAMVLEETYDALGGRVMRKRSLPAAMKRKLLSEMGFDLDANAA